MVLSDIGRMLSLEAEDLSKPTVCTIGWEPNVEAHVMIKMLEAWPVDSIDPGHSPMDPDHSLTPPDST